jgi:hypothetical protein
VLDKYSDPLLAGPEGMMDDTTAADIARQITSFPEMTPEKWRTLNSALGSARYRTPMREIKVVEGDTETLKVLPRYVEWSADLTSRLAQIKQTIEFLMMQSGTNPTTLGLETTSGVESGWALSIKTAGFKAKIRRRQQNWHKALVEAMYAALTIESRVMGGPSPEIPELVWPSGLPLNETEEIDNAIKMKSAGIASLETVVRKAQPELSDEGVLDELARIEKEKEEAMEAFAASAAGGFGGDEGEGDDS